MNLTLYKPHRHQLTIAKHPARFKVIAAGRRFGKSTLAISELVYFALTTNKALYWYVAPTYRQAKEIAWKILVDIYFKLPIELQRGKNEQELWVEIGNKSRISLKGADNEDSLRGSGLNGLVVDEVAMIRNWSKLWDEALSPSLVDKKGWAWFISTPKGYNHFFDMFNQELKDKEYKSFKFTTYDNPYIDPVEIEKERARKTADIFAQEYLAEFKRQSGLVFKEFDRNIHVIDPIDLPDAWTYYRAMDFGAVDPTVCLWMAVDHLDNIYIFDEYYNTGQTTRFNAEFINTKTRHRISQTFGDPSGNQEMLDYASFGLIISPAVRMYTQNQDWVNSGIQRVRELMKPDPQTGKSKFKVFKNCTNIIRDLESYAWKESKDNAREVPEHQFSHGPDATRYFSVSYNVQNMQQFVYEEPMKTNLYTGY